MISLSSNEWTINNIETVLIDKDGTFIDLHFFWGKMTELRAKEIINQYKLDISIKETLCNFLGYDLKTKKMKPDGITALYSRSKIIKIFNKNLKEIGINSNENELEKIFDKVSESFYKDIEKYTKPINSAINFIKELKKHNVKIGIVTSDSVISTNLTIKQFGWDGIFDCVIGRESSEHTKESGMPTKLALKQLQAIPDTTIMIGDAPMDTISANNAGIKNSILIATGQVSNEELKKYTEYTLNNLDELNIIKDSRQS